MEIDNRSLRLGEELKKVIQPQSKIKMAAATFSMYAFQELKDELETIDELKFIFTNPTFVTDETKTGFREYMIPKKDREQSIFGRQYELKLLNELTQKAIARECADWIRRKARFKSINVDEGLADGIRIEDQDDIVAVDRLKHFDRKELGYESSLFKTSRNLYHSPQSHAYLAEFDDYWENEEYFRDVTEEFLEALNMAYKEHSPEFLYYVMLYNIFSEFLEDINEDLSPNEKVGYKETKLWKMLYDFQKDAVKSIISKLEKYNGCILADSVGLGKTYTALAVMTYYAYRGKRILVLCPKKLENNWNMYRHDYINNPIYDRYLQYDVLYHTDLSREQGVSNGINLAQNRWDTYDLVVIDESHNFRNGSSSESDLAAGKENRYSRLMNRIIKEGVPTKVLMLSATPVNNRFNDLKNQLALAYEGDAANIDSKLEAKSSIDDIFRNAQSAYNKWADLPSEQRTTEALLRSLDFDFFKVLDSVTIARSRKHIREFYDRKAIGDFPQRLKPINYESALTVSNLGFDYKKIYQLLEQLQLTIYQPSLHIYPSKRSKYELDSSGHGRNLTQLGRESGIKKLMMINLLKRLESSVEAFRYTLIDVVKSYVIQTLNEITTFEQNGQEKKISDFNMNEDDFDIEDSNTDFFIGKKRQISLQDMDYLTWRRELEADKKILDQLEAMVNQITPQEDQKLQTLYRLIDQKIKNPINPGNKKLIIFSAFATTTSYLYRHISQYVLDKYGLHTAQISGVKGFETTLKTKNRDLNSLLTYFSPRSKRRDDLFPGDTSEIDLLIATDVISEGQNLQDADMLVNYDIHWNPVRIVQRFGRIDRIGSINRAIQLVNFWPNIDLDEYINLKARVEARMKISVLTSTADDNVLSNEAVEENNYRKKQLERLKEEVVDLEEMNEGISIMDLGLEDYRMDLLKYMEDHPDLERMPKGLQTVIPAKEDQPAGAIFVLKNTDTVKLQQQNNRLHPYYILYISESGESLLTPAEGKKALELLGTICRGQSRPLEDLVAIYNKKNKDGVKMTAYSQLLQTAVESIAQEEEVSTMTALFNLSSVNLMDASSKGLEDFELVCFFAVVKEEE